jgi:chemotaxis protein CheC
MSDTIRLSADQCDCLQEVVNVAMGQAGDSLARLLGVFVTLSVPKIEIVAPADVHRIMEGKYVSATRQAFQDGKGKDGLRGEALVVFGDSSFRELAELLQYDDEDMGCVAEQELLLDISNVLNGACLTGIADQLGEELFYSPPSILGQGERIAQMLERDNLHWESALSVEINYKLENRSFDCDLLLLMPDTAISHLAGKLDQILEDL